MIAQSDVNVNKKDSKRKEQYKRLSLLALRGRDRGMDQAEEKKLRATIKWFLNENRHGGIKKLMDASGLSRPTVSRFANGGTVEPESLQSLDAAINALEWGPPQPEAFDETNDALSDSIAILKDTILLIEDPDKGRGKKARLILKFLQIIESEFAAELSEIGRDE